MSGFHWERGFQLRVEPPCFFAGLIMFAFMKFDIVAWVTLNFAAMTYWLFPLEAIRATTAMLMSAFMPPAPFPSETTFCSVKHNW